jgi:hypothetical protein
MKGTCSGSEPEINGIEASAKRERERRREKEKACSRARFRRATKSRVEEGRDEQGLQTCLKNKPHRTTKKSDKVNQARR